MLEDFVQVNGLSAKILPYAAKGRLVNCRLFRAGSENVLAIFFANDKVSTEKLKELLKVESVKPVDIDSAEEITGCNPDFLPPISIYGVKVILDKKASQVEKLRCLISDEKTLEMSPKEVLEANEDSLEADITL